MEYAYANIRWDGTVGITPGHYVAVVHDTASLFFIAPEQVEELETKGKIDRDGMYVRMIKFHPEDQFANIVLPEEVKELAEAADNDLPGFAKPGTFDHHDKRVEEEYDDMERDAERKRILKEHDEKTGRPGV